MKESNSFNLASSIALTIVISLGGIAFLGNNLGLVLFIIVGSAWMFTDSQKRDLSKLTGVASNLQKPYLWLVAGLVLFVITFPLYLSKVYKRDKPFFKSTPGMMLLVGLISVSVNAYKSISSGLFSKSINAEIQRQQNEETASKKVYASSSAAVLDGESAVGNTLEFNGQYYGVQTIDDTQVIYVIDTSAGVNWYLTFDDEQKINIQKMTVGQTYKYNCTISKISMMNVCHLN